MNAAVHDIVHRLRDAYRRENALALLFDYDGTLTPIVNHPRLAVLDSKTRQLLARLTARPRVHVGVLSGRELDDLKARVDLPGLYLAGTGGLELDMRGVRIEHPHANRLTGIIERLAAQLHPQVAAYPGAWLERKRLGLTVHYRQLPGQLLGSLHAVVAEAARHFAGELRIVQGPKAWEITPAMGWNKGTAIRLILADCGASGEGLFYAGDGANDAEAISQVAAMSGITVGIGPDAPLAAQYRLPNHAALRALLGYLDASLEKHRPHFARSSKSRVGSRDFWRSAIHLHTT